MALSNDTKWRMKVALAKPSAGQELIDAVDQVEMSQLADDTIKYAQVTIAHAAILTLGTVPVTLVAAPGSGYFIDPISVVAYYDYNTAAYTLAAETVDVEYGSGATVLGGLLSNAELVGSADVRKNMRQAVATLAPVDNSKLQLTTSSNGDPTDGNAASSIKVRVYYRVVPYSLQTS